MNTLELDKTERRQRAQEKAQEQAHIWEFNKNKLVAIIYVLGLKTCATTLSFP